MSNRLKILISLFLACSTIAPVLAQSDAEVLRLHGIGDWKRIKNAAIDCIKTHPKSCYCRTSLVESHIQLKDYKSAERELNKLNGICKPDAHQLFLWSLLRLQQGQPRAALSYADRMMATGTKHPNHLGLYESILFQVDRAKWLTVSCDNRAFPNSRWYLSGGRTGAHARALAELRRLLDPKAPVLLTNNAEFVAGLMSKVPRKRLLPAEQLMMAQAQAILRHEAEALDWCAPIAVEFPNESLQLTRGFAALGLRYPQKVLRILQQIEPQCTGNDVYWIVKNFAYRESGEFEKAAECTERAIKIKNTEESLWLRYHTHQQQQATNKNSGAAEHFLDDLNEVVRHYPTIRSHTERAKVYHEQGLYPEELRDIDAVIALLKPGPEQLQMQRRKADVQFMMGDLPAATATAKAVLAQDPGNAHCIRLLKRIDAELKRAE